jgi:putative transposase
VPPEYSIVRSGLQLRPAGLPERPKGSRRRKAKAESHFRAAHDWTVQQARNLALGLGERFEGYRFLIRYRGSNFTRSFDAVFQAAGTTILRTAIQAPRMNAICERLVGTLRREILGRSLILGEAHLRTVLAEYQEHYKTARPHQGIDQRIPDTEHHPPRVIAADLATHQIRRKPVLSGLINEYIRAA